jgi:spore coat protein H
MPMFRVESFMRKIVCLQILFLSIPFSINGQNLFPDYPPIYQDDVVARIDITLPPDSLALILDPENAKSDYPYHATFIFNNGTILDTFENVGIQLRGNTSRTAKKKSFQVSLNTYDPGRDWYGVEKLDLNGEHNDPTISRSKICWDLLRDIGVPAPRASHVELYINQTYFGLYANIEHIDEEFVKSRFGNKDGNLYKCLWPADLTYLGTDPDLYKLHSGGRRVYELKTNEEADDYTDLAHFIDILNNAPVNELQCELEHVLNVHSLLKCIAFDVMTGNWDGPVYNKNNFFLYHNTASGLLEYIPYDLDNTFGIDWFGEDWSTRNIYSWGHQNQPRPLYWRILAVPEFKAEYSYYLDKMINEWYKESVLFPRLDSLKNLLAPYVVDDVYYAEDYGFSIDDFNKGFGQSLPFNHITKGIKPFIASRKSATIQQLQLSDIPPVISTITNNPSTSSRARVLNVFVEDDQGVDFVEAVIQLKSTGPADQFAMLDDGLHQDGEPEDGIYGLILPSPDTCELFMYWISATDIHGKESKYPVCGANSLMICNSSLMLAINEIMASNEATVADEAGEFEDWVEIYNYGTEPIYLGDLYLSDKADDPVKWKFPDLSIQPGEYLLTWLDEDGEQGDLHANFKLSEEGEFIGIYDNDKNGNALIDGIQFGEQQTDVSYGRLPNGSGSFQFLIPTPGSMNEISSAVIAGLPIAEYNLYPNPAHDVIWIQADREISTMQLVVVMDVYGKVFLTKTFSGKTSLNISGLPAGIYMLGFKDGVSMRKVVKQ